MAGQDELGSRAWAQRDRLDLAARAAWLYYMLGRTQEEIAAKLGTSRPGVQRLLALAVAEKLIKFRLDHPIAACMELTERLSARYGLNLCEIVPSDGSTSAVPAIAACTASILERHLAQKAPMVVGMGTGRTLRATVLEVSPMNEPQHKIVSLVGNLVRDGRATPYDVVIRLAERVGAQCYPLPTPLIVDTPEHLRLLADQAPIATMHRLAASARVSFLGLAPIAWQAPLHVDGFITDGELAELIEMGAVGEMGGWAFDHEGRLLEGGTNARITSLRPCSPPTHLTIGVAAGHGKVPVLKAALAGSLLTGLITDEATAKAILEE